MEKEIFKFPIIDMEQTGKRIQELCELNQVDIQKLADYFSISKQTIKYWFSGRNIPSFEHLKALSLIFNLSVEDIIVLKKE